MKEEKQIRLIRVSIYLLIWILLFLFPFISNNQNGEMRWNRVYGDWIRFLPFLIIFFIHHFALLPILVIKKKKGLYLIITLGLIFLVSVLTPNLRFLNELIQDVGPPRLEPKGPPLEPFGDRPPERMPNRPNAGAPGPVQPLMFYNFLVSVMLVGFDAAITITSDWFKQERRTREIEKDQMQTELAFLRNQVSPHFFMNTLNNIHALIENEKDRAQSAVIRLSKLMRYLLYETGETVPLAKELEFISSYFELMRMRYDDKVKIDLQVPSTIPNKKIHPLLCISFIENAFKHGISYQSESFVEVKIDVEDENIEFRISNSISNGSNIEGITESPNRAEGELTDRMGGNHGITESPNHGIGLENVKKQLHTLYNTDYKLEIRHDADSFFVYLKIPLQND